jgi:hypothetical protein
VSSADGDRPSALFLEKAWKIGKLIVNLHHHCVKGTIMAREERNIIGYTVALISEFALRFGIRPRQAYAYLKRFKGIEHLREHYGVLHTQSFPDTVDVLAQVCLNNGGQLR